MAQKKLAKTVQVSDPWLSRIEQGHVWPSDKLLARIAHALDVEPDELLDRTALGTSDVDQPGRLIAEQLKRGIGDVEEEPGRPWDDVAERLPDRVFELTDRHSLARLMISLLPDPDDDRVRPGPESILICRYSTEDVLRVAPDALRAWGRRLQQAMKKGWSVDHIRSEAAWREEMRHVADTAEVGGPIPLLNRLGFKGEYRPYSVPASADRAARLAHLDVPGRGTLIHDSQWHGCFVPPLEEFTPLTKLLRDEALDLVAEREALVTPVSTDHAGALDRGLQRRLREIETAPGDQILVKIGLNVVLEPTELWSAVVERAAREGFIDHYEKADLQDAHKARRELFLKNVRSSRVMDVCPRKALQDFARTGRFQPGSAEEPLALSPGERGRFLEAVVTLLDDSPKYELAIVDAAPFDLRCIAKGSRAPVVCIETPHAASDRAWAMVREPTFCKSLLTHLRLWYADNASDRNEVRALLLDLANQARAEPWDESS